MLALSACKKKDDNRQYSTWYINGARFSTNDVNESSLKESSSLGASNAGNGFLVDFHKWYFPDSGSWPIQHGGSNPADSIHVLFWYNGQTYTASPTNHVFVDADITSGKASYQLPKSSFINISDSSDVIVAEGFFTRP